MIPDLIMGAALEVATDDAEHAAELEFASMHEEVK